MCLLIHIRAYGIPRKQAGSVTKQVQGAGGARLEARRQPKSAKGSLFSLGRGCACEFLGDEVQCDAPLFGLDAEKTAEIETTLNVIRDASAGRAFTVEAEWTDGPLRGAKDARSVTFAALLDDIQQGRIANRVAYEVT